MKRSVKRNGELSKPMGPGPGTKRPDTSEALRGKPARNLDAIAKMKSALAAQGLLSPRPAWRPAKYDPDFCEEIIEFCSQGRSLTSFAAKIKVAPTTLNQWAAKYSDFRDALSIAKASAAAWHDEKGVAIVANGDRGGQGAMAKFYLQHHARDEFGEQPASSVVVNNNTVSVQGLDPAQAMERFRAMLRGEEPPRTIEGEVGE